MILHNLQIEENKTNNASIDFRIRISFIITSVSTATSLYILIALFHYKWFSSPTINAIRKRMIYLNLSISFLAFTNALTNMIFPILVKVLKSDEFCNGYFSTQLAIVYLSRIFTYAFFWTRQQHFYKNLQLKVKYLTVCQRVCNFPRIAFGKILPITEYCLLFKYSAVRVYHKPAGMWGCSYERTLKKTKYLSFFLYSLQSLLFISLIFLVLVPLIIKKRNKQKLNLIQLACKIEKTIPRLAASIFVTCLSNLLFVKVAVLVEKSFEEVSIDKPVLVLLIFNANMIANLILLQLSFTDYKRRLLFQRKMETNSNLRLASCMPKGNLAQNVSSVIISKRSVTTKT